MPDTCYRRETYYETVTTTISGGSGGNGGNGGHGFFETFDETVTPGNVIEVRFEADGRVRVAEPTVWGHIAYPGGDGGRGGNGGNGNASGGPGAKGSDVTDDDNVLYRGDAGASAQGHDGGAGGRGASGVRISNQRGYKVLPGSLAVPFQLITAGTGYSAPNLFTQIGRGQDATQRKTSGGVYLIGTVS